MMGLEGRVRSHDEMKIAMETKKTREIIRIKDKSECWRRSRNASPV
jgi:hypothetical protein